MKCPPKKIAEELARYFRDLGYQALPVAKLTRGSEVWSFWVYAADASYPDPRSVEVIVDDKTCEVFVEKRAPDRTPMSGHRGHSAAFANEVQRVIEDVRPHLAERVR